MMDKILRGLEDIEVHYLDDMMIHTKGTLEEHCDAVEKVLKRLIDNNLAINLSKCVMGASGRHLVPWASTLGM